jgi:hypothetical protein
MNLVSYQIAGYKNGAHPYEGHYLHTDAKVDVSVKVIKLKKGDIVINTRQKNRRFLISVLEPNAPDSYFAWNFFDSYLQQKEYFSPYVFEDKAVEILKEKKMLRKQFEEKREQNKEFRESYWDQLYFIYKNSEHYEPSHNIIPLNSGMYINTK